MEMKGKTKRMSRSRRDMIRQRKAERVVQDSMRSVDMGVKELGELTVGLRGCGSFIIEEDGVRSDS